MFNHVDHVEQIGALKALAADVGQIAYDIHEYLGTGLLEKVYESAFEHRLQKFGSRKFERRTVYR